LYLSLEDDETLIAEKLEMLRDNRPSPGEQDDFCLMFQTSGLDGNLLETLHKWAEVYPSTRLIVTRLWPFFSKPDTRENGSQMRALLKGYRRLGNFVMSTSPPDNT
jgi:hypothetical protein